MNYKQIFAIELKNKQRIKEVCPSVPDSCGIYILKRYDNDFKYAYIGQAKKILTRLAQHLNGYQHIDLSLKKHGLYSNSNLDGWQISWVVCSLAELDDMEKEYIKIYANKGYQLRNKTAGGQNCGKFEINESRPKKGYHDGVKQGYLNAQREIAHLFKLHLDVKTKKEPPTKLQEKAMAKFKKFIDLD